jgi:DNA-binding NtrC family response regulator
LNERIEDIPLLASHFLQQICGDYGIPVKNINPDAVKELMEIQWTGNIREFRNVVERLIILGEKEIRREDVISFARHTKQS